MINLSYVVEDENIEIEAKAYIFHPNNDLATWIILKDFEVFDDSLDDEDSSNQVHANDACLIDMLNHLQKSRFEGMSANLFRFFYINANEQIYNLGVEYTHSVFSREYDISKINNRVLLKDKHSHKIDVFKMLAKIPSINNWDF